ncbi:MAG TPA: putative Ig domain-containing protein, partial [Candidatus Binatia bacterium]|nr:putative Ig domain-containing protein [Candidatus Binatia bacterium]
SYDWSFGHSVPGSFRTIMAYSCASPCPRILHYSNPDVLYKGVRTGIPDQRDNAWTGDLIAPIVAAFRSGSIGVANNPPRFTSDPISKPNANQGTAYSGSLASNANDPDNDPLAYAKNAGPAWLNIAVNGALTGTPSANDLGINTFTVSVSDGKGGSDSATLQINVVGGLNAPSNLAGSSTVSRRIELTWNDNSGNEKGFRIERSTNGSSFTRIATRSTNVTAYSDAKRTSGRTYYYRVRSYNRSGQSAYSNTISVVAK